MRSMSKNKITFKTISFTLVLSTVQTENSSFDETFSIITIIFERRETVA